MKNRFYVFGMTCSGCVKSIRETLKSEAEVNEVRVSLETGLMEIQSKKKFSTSEISTLLGSKYTVQKKISNSKKISATKVRQLTPLLIIFIYLIAGTLFISYQIDLNLEKSMQIFMGLFFIVFSFFKFLDYKGFPDSFKRYDPLAKRIPVYAKIYPFLETIIGIAFILDWNLELFLLITIGILSFTTYGVIRALIIGSDIECACLGTVLKLPMTEATLIENGIMLSMSIMLLMRYNF
jgi:copper chaperone CopZ